MILLNKDNEALVLNSDSVTITDEVNNFAEMASFFTSRSVSISAKNIPHNRKLLGFTGVISSATRFPYLKSDVWRVYDGGYEVFGDARITVLGFDGDEINVSVSSGINNFLNLLDNKQLGDFADGLTHINTMQNIRQGSAGLKPYHYIFGYNFGKMLNAINDTVNYALESVMPSVGIDYLLDEIFNSVGWTYEFIGTEEYKEDFLLYPSGLEEGDDNSILNFEESIIRRRYVGQDERIYPASSNVFTETPPIFSKQNDGIFIANESGSYKIDFAIDAERENIIGSDVFLNIRVGTRVYQEYVSGALNFELNEYINQGEGFSFWFSIRDREVYSDVLLVNSGNIKIYTVGTSTIDFSEALMDIPVSDFFKEVLVRYTVIPYVDEVNKKITFITQSKRLNSNVVTIPTEHIRNIKVNYQADMARNNWLRHKYPEDNLSYADGNIIVQNENLERNKTIYESFTFAPEGRVLMSFGGRRRTRAVDALRQFESEAKDVEGVTEVEYKHLDGRYYIFKAIQTNFDTYVGGNLVENIRLQEAITFKEIAQDYEVLSSVLDDYKEYTIQLDKKAYLFIKDAKIVNIDTIGVLAVTKIAMSGDNLELTGLWRK